MSKDDLCKMVAKAWANVSEEVIKKSFLVTGQSKDSSPSDISCLKEGRECHSALKELRKCGTNRSKSWKKLTILPKRMKQRTKKMN